MQRYVREDFLMDFFFVKKLKRTFYFSTNLTIISTKHAVLPYKQSKMEGLIHTGKMLPPYLNVGIFT